MGAAPNQTHMQVGSKEATIPVGLEPGGHLGNHRRRLGQNPVVARFGEVFVGQIEGGNQGGLLVDHDRLFVGDRKGLTGPGHVDALALQQGIGLVIPAIATRGVGIEHHPHPHAALVGPQQGLLDRLALQLELLEAQLGGGLVDQRDHGLGAVIGHHQQALAAVAMLPGLKALWGCGVSHGWRVDHRHRAAVAAF